MSETILKTERLILRPWHMEDAQALYEYARDPRVGPIAGWPVHTGVDNSREIIRDVLSKEETYAVALKGDSRPVGSIGLISSEEDGWTLETGSGEIGYWIGVPFWGRGLIPEAVRELMRHGFEDLGLRTLWCGYYEGNDRSRRVQEKCGFVYHHTEHGRLCPLMHETRITHFSCITKEQWRQNILGGRS